MWPMTYSVDPSPQVIAGVLTSLLLVPPLAKSCYPGSPPSHPPPASSFLLHSVSSYLDAHMTCAFTDASPGW